VRDALFAAASGIMKYFSVDKHKFGPWAVVAGASSGIGKEFARQLARSGLNVVLVARRESLLHEVGSQLASEFGIQYRAVAVDLSLETSIAPIASATEDLDIGLLVVSAGTGQIGRFFSYSLEELNQLVDLNVLSNLRLTHYFGKRLAKHRRGGVLLLSALGASEGFPFSANGAATKAYVISLGKSLHAEFEELGLNITVLLPSLVDTPLVPELGFTKDNLPTKPMPVGQCVAEGLQALSQNRMVFIPGGVFRFANAVVPTSVVRKMGAKTFLKIIAARSSQTHKRA
jgi:short-subunit dehydrogenase